MDLITAVTVDLATGVVVTAVLTVVVELAVAAVAAAVVVLVPAVVTDMVVLIGLLQQVMDMTLVQEQQQGMAMVEGMVMEAMLALGPALAVGMVAPCMVALMVHMVPTVVVPMEEALMEGVHMEVAPMVLPQVAMAPADMVVMGEPVERVVLVVGVQVLGVLAGIIHMENKQQLQSVFLGHGVLLVPSRSSVFM
jgi:hypothetical protein